MILYKETRNLESVDLFYGIGEWKFQLASSCDTYY